MKKAVFILSMVLMATGCGSSDDTAFLAPSKPDSEGGDGRRERAVEVEIIVGISGGQSKGRSPSSGSIKGDRPKIVARGGNKPDLGDEGDKGDKGDKGIGLPYSENAREGVSGPKVGKNVDILFYLGHKWHGSCWKH